MKKDIVIVGNGGFARETKWLLERINQVKEEWNFLGFIDEVDSFEGSRVIGNDAFILSVEKELHVALAIGNAAIRERIYEKYKKNSYLRYPNLIDPSVIMSSQVELGRGNIICAGNILTVNVKMGDFCIVNLDCTLGHDVVFDSFITIYPGVNVSGAVTIERCTEIGTGTKIIQGKKIGKNAVVGAGAVVITDIPDNCTAVGVPAKVIKYH